MNHEKEQTGGAPQQGAGRDKQSASRMIFWRIVVAVVGGAIGVGVLFGIDSLLVLFGLKGLAAFLVPVIFAFYVIAALAFGFIFYLASPAIIVFFRKLSDYIEKKIDEIPTMDLVAGVIGLIVGLVIALLLSNLINLIPVPVVPVVLSAAAYVALGCLGWTIGRRRRGELKIGESSKRGQKGEKAAKAERGAPGRPKVLDTSVIIDGRIFDICKTGIVEGTIVIPNFVLQELRHVADSADSLKRNRGRRGLDILNKIQKELEIPVRVEERDYDDIAEVDAKLLKLASDLGGVVVTNDYNLNKVAAVQGVPVLNINELANAVKPVVLPGEEMEVTILKDGKEAGQGVAYLDDGTMIVVDGGKKYMNETIEVVVTSVLQTAAGRMIFAKIK